LFNLREGVEEDKLPSRLFKESFTKGPAKDVVLNEEEFQKSLHDYYALRGWDEYGIPTNKKLQELGIEKYSKQKR
jgi:aldehyde:ferredoxin oxidoreductase